MAFNKQQAQAPHANPLTKVDRHKDVRQSVDRRKRATRTASRCLLESLENRQLMAFSANVNFQPLWSATPSGNYPDVGLSYGSRFGITYGWNQDNSSNAVRRFQNNDLRLDTFANFGSGNQARSWEIDVPSGTYNVTLSAGDPASNDAYYIVNVENQTAINGSPTANNRFIERSVTVVVTDGKLTVSSGDGPWNNRLNFINVQQVSDRTTLTSGTNSNTNVPLPSPAPTPTPTPSPTPSPFPSPASGAPYQPWSAWVNRGNGSDLSLTWQDGSSNEEGFRIEVSTDGWNWNRVATTPANATAFLITGLPANTRYTVRVQAFNSVGSSEFRLSNTVTTGSSNPNPTPAPTPAPAPTPTPIPQPTPGNNGGSVRPVINDASIANRYDRVTFSDEFNGWSLDQSKWRHEFPGPRRHAVDVPEAVSVENGDLVIRTYTENNIHYTGIVSTRDNFSQAQGYYEARIDFDSAPGMWSAFWIHSWNMHNGNAGRSPGNASSLGNEVDVVEHRSHDAGNNYRGNKASLAVHWDGYRENQRTIYEDSDRLGNINADQGYHVYGVEWTNSAYNFYVNGRFWYTLNRQVALDRGITTNPISNFPQFLILSSEVQNGIWAGNVPNGGYGDRASTNVKMKVDYVRVFASSTPIA